MVGSNDDLRRRDRWARLRFAIIGPLLAAPPAPGDLQTALSALADRTWRHPLTGLDVRFGASTIERWFYAARHAADPVTVLRNQVRRDIGGFLSVGPQAQEVLRLQYAEHPGWTAQLHHDNLRVRLAAVDPGVPCPSYSSVRRYLKAQGLTRKRPARRGDPVIPGAGATLVEREIRSYEVEYVLQLMHLDFHHGSRKVLSREGEWVKPLLVAFVDDRSRYLAHAQWYTSEGTAQLVHGFSQALSKVGLPRSLMSDRGSAMMSGEFTAGLAALGILHVPTLPRSPHVNGKQENLWSRVEGRLLAMLEGEERLTLDQLNLATCAWVTQEYHRTVHREIGATPLQRYLEGPSVARACPGSDALRAAFRIEAQAAGAPLRRHGKPRGASLRDPHPLPALQRGPPALCALGFAAGGSDRSAARDHPLPGIPDRQGRQCRAAAPHGRAPKPRPDTGRLRRRAAFEADDRRLRRHGAAAGVPARIPPKG